MKKLKTMAEMNAGLAALNPSLSLKIVDVPASEKPPAFGAFAFRLSDKELVQRVDAVLSQYLGSAEHRSMMTNFGFSKTEIDLVAT